MSAYDDYDETVARIRASMQRSTQADLRKQLATQRSPVPRVSTGLPTKAERAHHVKLLVNNARSETRYFTEGLADFAKAGVDEQDQWVKLLKSSTDAHKATMQATEALVDDFATEITSLRSEVKRLRRELGNEAAKEQQRKAAAALIARGAVAITGASTDVKFISAKVRDGSTTHTVGRKGNAWTCSCAAIDCDHVHAVQLLVFKCEPKGARKTPAALAASGAVTILGY